MDLRATSLIAKKVGKIRHKRKNPITKILLLSIAGCVINSSFQVGFVSDILTGYTSSSTSATELSPSVRQAVEECRRNIQFRSTQRFTYRSIKLRRCIHSALEEESAKSESTDTYSTEADFHFIVQKISEKTYYYLSVVTYCTGACIGSLLAGRFTDVYGRKPLILLSNITLVLGMAIILVQMLHFYYQYWILDVGRFFCGLYTGLNCVLVSIYLSEIAPVQYRGMISSINPIVMMLAYIISAIYNTDYSFGETSNWGKVCIITAVPMILQLIIFPFAIESPIYLKVFSGKNKVMKSKPRAMEDQEDQEELDDRISKSVDEEMKDAKDTFRDLFTKPYLKLAVLVGVLCQLAESAGGEDELNDLANTLEEYNGEEFTIFNQLEVTLATASFFGSLIGGALMDNVGRRKLHLFGLGGMIIILLLITVTFILRSVWANVEYVSLGLMIVYVIFYGNGPGTVPWLIVPELFGHQWRGRAVGVIFAIAWLMTLGTDMVFEEFNLKSSWFNYCLLPVAAVLTAVLYVLYYYMPETKDKTVMEIREALVRGDIQSLTAEKTTTDHGDASSANYGSTTS